jgi:HNH endonuclease
MSLFLPLDHFLPASTHPDQSQTYENLVYCCARCNEIKRNRAVPDPCRFLVNGDITVRRDGTLVIRSPEAHRIVQKLGLAEREATEFRLLWIGILDLAERYEPLLFERLMGYPEDLPDLSRLRPPGGNSRRTGIAESFYARRKAGTLPAVY